jgi:hypothetical protein
LPVLVPGSLTWVCIALAPIFTAAIEDSAISLGVMGIKAVSFFCILLPVIAHVMMSFDKIKASL